MRSPVYRNLDRPFRIFGFTPLELIGLCVSFVGGGEAAQSLGLSRVWAFLFTAVVGLSLFCFRRTLGDAFGPRLIRFLRLPDALSPKLFTPGDFR